MVFYTSVDFGSSLTVNSLRLGKLGGLDASLKGEFVGKGLNIGGIVVGGVLAVTFDNGDREGGGTEAFVGEAFSGCSVVGCKLTPNICDVVG